ncbi:putative polyketide synthase protein [Neofusicoccum parvum UCRNP2]|uniref:Putative polyketide synthase protein n=1 Tax=Botryosphaeria parva (strain UCR-NP2) TaxID=1287680 RepID=R1GH07_BOTPV|nr:putative polyketide synthase protein [Neofusicoccum parvum UCRNP2]
MSPSQITTLSSLGFVVVAADYRLCPHVTLWDGPLADARHVHAWSRTQLPSLLARDVPGATLDPTKTVAVGYSAGALLALHLVGQALPPPLPLTPNPTRMPLRLTRERCPLQGTLDPAPAAVADFYGAKRLRDPSWHAPLPALARLPPLDPALLRRVFDEPPATSTGASESLEKGGSADDDDGSS